MKGISSCSFATLSNFVYAYGTNNLFDVKHGERGERQESPGLEPTGRHHYSETLVIVCPFSSTLELLVPQKINLSAATTWGNVWLIPFNSLDLSEKVICLLPQCTIDLLWDYLTL